MFALFLFRFSGSQLRKTITLRMLRLDFTFPLDKGPAWYDYGSDQNPLILTRSSSRNSPENLRLRRQQSYDLETEDRRPLR